MKIECPENNYINLSESNLSNEHLSCIIRSRKIHQGVENKRAWLDNQAFAKKYGFEVVDRTASGYEVLALSFDGKKAYFNENAKKETITSQDLTIYFDDQCPYTYDRISSIKEYCELKNIALSLIQVLSLEMAKNLPCAFNNWALFYKGKFITLNLLDVSSIEKILKKY